MAIVVAYDSMSRQTFGKPYGLIEAGHDKDMIKTTTGAVTYFATVSTIFANLYPGAKGVCSDQSNAHARSVFGEEPDQANWPSRLWLGCRARVQGPFRTSRSIYRDAILEAIRLPGQISAAQKGKVCSDSVSCVVC